MQQEPDFDINASIDESYVPKLAVESGPTEPGRGGPRASPSKTRDLRDPRVVEGLVGAENPHILTAKEHFAAVGAYVLGAFVLVIIITLLVLHSLQLPKAPSLVGMKPDDPSVKAAIDNYRQLSEIADRQLATTFDLLITKPLLPVLATLIGYLIGQSSKRSAA